jgi:hypothetical protein
MGMSLSLWTGQTIQIMGASSAKIAPRPSAAPSILSGSGFALALTHYRSSANKTTSTKHRASQPGSSNKKPRKTNAPTPTHPHTHTRVHKAQGGTTGIKHTQRRARSPQQAADQPRTNAVISCLKVAEAWTGAALRPFSRGESVPLGSIEKHGVAFVRMDMSIWIYMPTRI